MPDPYGTGDAVVAPLTEEDYEEAERPRRSLWGLVALLIVTAVIIVILLLLRDRTGGSEDEGRRDGKSIERVRGSKPAEGLVSVWIEPGTSIAHVLRDARVVSRERIDMGGGRWVIGVRPGTENEAAVALARQGSVYDAGRVYER